MNEAQFEKELIEYITTGDITSIEASEERNSGRVGEPMADYIVKTKLWQYEPQIKTTEDLWANFKAILEQHNQNTLDHPLSVPEFNQVKNEISNLTSPYKAGQFLYGYNGVSQVEVDLDDGQHVYLTVFDQKQIGAGDTVYQVVNQISREPKIIGKQKRIFDTTLLINGLPIIQIEEKTDTHNVDEALNQMHQYIAENQYSDIFSTVQILIGITPNNVKYMANTTVDKFNKNFAFNWQRKSDNTIVRDWRVFADSMLSIPMAHQMATNYMILDGTKNRQSLKVMRPYQVYATQNVIESLKKIDFEFGSGKKAGYIWHTTGSGKTITSFKTAWLASRMPQVDKVVFVVDRIALTKQTSENYKAYDPDGDVEDSSKVGSVSDTDNTNALSRSLKSKKNGIIVTSVQKLGTLVKRKSFKAPDKNIVFIVDEAHRSTGSVNFATIQKAFPRSAWVGYTGTPMFDDTTKGLRTEDIFGKLLHAYTIREAIADKNVLGFKVDFETTIPEDEMREKYLPDFYRDRYPKWTEEQIKEKIDNLTPEDMDDTISPSFYDMNEDHVKLVVADIFKNWWNRSSEGRYNAMLTTRVAGKDASTPMAMMYYREFQRVNAERKANGECTLKVAVTFSRNTSNNDTQLVTNEGLYEAIQAYNEEFGQSFGMDNVSGYTQDVTSRLNRTATDGNYLDLVIVVDQLLTGFDAPEMNTLYVDRTLKSAGLIQAYSRTNRIADRDKKPWGRIVNYRWPKENEQLMNDALAIYANKESANLSPEEKRSLNKKDGVLAESFPEVFEKVKKTVDELDEMTNQFVQLPPSEKKQDRMLALMREYNNGISKLKQYDPVEVNGEMEGFDYQNPDELIEKLGMTPEQNVSLTTVLANELRENKAKRLNVPVYQIDLRMTHVKDVEVDYDYLTELVEQLLNEVHDEEMKAAAETREKIIQFANGLEDRQYASKIKNAAEMIFQGLYVADKYPPKLANSDGVIEAANNMSLDRIFLDFRYHWGITDVVTTAQLRQLFSRHRYGMKDLDDANQITDILMKGSENYEVLAHDEAVQQLSRVKYRNNLREAIYKLADDLYEQ